jgi:hypothetical protein
MKNMILAVVVLFASAAFAQEQCNLPNTGTVGKVYMQNYMDGVNGRERAVYTLKMDDWNTAMPATSNVCVIEVTGYTRGTYVPGDVVMVNLRPGKGQVTIQHFAPLSMKGITDPDTIAKLTKEYADAGYDGRIGVRSFVQVLSMQVSK